MASTWCLNFCQSASTQRKKRTNQQQFGLGRVINWTEVLCIRLCEISADFHDLRPVASISCDITLRFRMTYANLAWVICAPILMPGAFVSGNRTFSQNVGVCGEIFEDCRIWFHTTPCWCSAVENTNIGRVPGALLWSRKKFIISACLIALS